MRQARQAGDVTQIRNSFRTIGELTSVTKTIQPDRFPTRLDGSPDVVIDPIPDHDRRTVIGKRAECAARCVERCPLRLGRRQTPGYNHLSEETAEPQLFQQRFESAVPIRQDRQREPGPSQLP